MEVLILEILPFTYTRFMRLLPCKFSMGVETVPLDIPTLAQPCSLDMESSLLSNYKGKNKKEKKKDYQTNEPCDNIYVYIYNLITF